MCDCALWPPASRRLDCRRRTFARRRLYLPTTISPAVDQACSTLLAAPALQKVFADVRADDSRVLQEHRHLSEIPAPPFKEKARANYLPITASLAKANGSGGLLGGFAATDDCDSFCDGFIRIHAALNVRKRPCGGILAV
jgi:hypothetical protein